MCLFSVIGKHMNLTGQMYKTQIEKMRILKKRIKKKKPLSTCVVCDEANIYFIYIHVYKNILI